ncbi:MAG: flagellar hook-basal body complex protein FliE [Nitrospira sp.]|nr:flagellar hook-basal body complex protein FliE [Nitrospira sp.]
MKEIGGITSSIGSPSGGAAIGAAGGIGESAGFMESLKQAIGQVNDAQLQAGRAVDALMTGESEDIHRAMVALQQADVSFQLMMQIRNKLIAAYEEIQRMQV